MLNHIKCRIVTCLFVLSQLAITTPMAMVEESQHEFNAQEIYTVGDYMKKREVSGMRISPNGKKLVFTMPYQDDIILVFSEMVGTKLKHIAKLPFNKDTYPINPTWTANDRVVFTLKTKTKIRGTRYYVWSELLMSIKSDGSELVTLRTDGGRGGLKHIDNADIISVLRDDEDHILVGKSRLRNWIEEYYEGSVDDVYKLNVRTGDLSLYLKGPKISSFKFHDWHSDHKGHIRFGYGYDRKGNSVMIIRGRGEDDWKVLSDNELFEEGKFTPLQFGAGDNEFYVLSSLATGRMAIYRFDISTGELGDLVYAHDQVDVTGIIYSFDKGKVVAARYNDGGEKIIYLDEGYENMRTRIQKAIKVGFNIWSISDDDQNMIVLAGDERDAGSFYHYDVAAKNINYLGSRLTKLIPEQLSPMEYVSYESRDGLTINAVMTKPRLHDGKPLPFIIMPHNSPNGRDSVEWDRRVQFLVNRGYGVFQPNYRGSSGFGQRFKALGRGEWGRDMQNDLIDGTEWLIDEGHADQERICILGRGYAGYAALLGIAKESDLFACAIARDAPVDIRKLLSSERAYDKENKRYLDVAGDLDKKKLDEISPAKLISSIEGDVLLYHREDSNYDVKHMRSFVKALKKAGKRFDYLEIEKAKGKNLYDGNEDDRRFWGIVEAWLLGVNPTPLLEQAHKSGKMSAMPEMNQSNR